MNSDYVIWWTTAQEQVSIGEHLPETFPEYMRKEYRSRTGRNGRGRLWVSSHIVFDDAETMNAFDTEATPLKAHLGQWGAGIVIEKAHAELLIDYPGTLTDTKLQRYALGINE